MKKLFIKFKYFNHEQNIIEISFFFKCKMLECDIIFILNIKK